MKNCKACKEPFEPRRPLQKVCSLTCSIDLVNTEKVKKVKAETREMKKRVRDKDRSYWVKKAQEVFNQWIRLRDDKKAAFRAEPEAHVSFMRGTTKRREVILSYDSNL
jgi:hypothetical protein